MSNAAPSNDAPDRSGRWAPWVATGIIVLIVIGAIAAYFRPEAFKGPDRKRFPEAAITGIACGPLRQMEAALKKGETAEVKAAVSDAATKAIEALDSSGISFGKPEKFALRLSGRDLTNLTTYQLGKLQQNLNVVVGSACPIVPRREPV